MKSVFSKQFCNIGCKARTDRENPVVVIDLKSGMLTFELGAKIHVEHGI